MHKYILYPHHHPHTLTILTSSPSPPHTLTPSPPHPHHPHHLAPSQVNRINLAADNPLEFARCLLSAAQTVTLSIKRQVSNHILCMYLLRPHSLMDAISCSSRGLEGVEGGEEGRGGGEGRERRREGEKGGGRGRGKEEGRRGGEVKFAF